MQTKTIRINNSDNVAVALTNLYKGEQVHGESFSSLALQDNISAKHKFALNDLQEGDPVVMYGVLVGKAMQFIPQGGLISTKNIQHASESFGLKEHKTAWAKPDVSVFENKTFMGFHRADGSVGTRNFWLVIPLVFCENKNVDVMQEAFMKALGYQPKKSPYESMVQHYVQQYQSGKNKEEILLDDVESENLYEPETKIFSKY